MIKPIALDYNTAALHDPEMVGAIGRIHLEIDLEAAYTEFYILFYSS